MDVDPSGREPSERFSAVSLAEPLRYAVLALTLILALALAQGLIDDRPAELLPLREGTPAIAEGYLLTQDSPHHATLKLHGLRRRLQPGEITLLWIPHSTADPVRAPFRATGPASDSESFEIDLQVPPGTYKIALPDTRPFGLLDVGKR